MRQSFDLDLFVQLNREYESKPLVQRHRRFTPESRRIEADKRTARLDRRLDLRGKRVLEIGCGTGAVGLELVERLDCTVVGIDIERYDTWDDATSDRISYVQGDISNPPPGLGKFDAMFSFSVWEHLVHPYAALVECHKRLEPGGKMFMQAQLHRGPKASHRTRDVFFPWPHLLFTDDVFEDYYRSIGREPKRPAWLNHLTYGQYVDAFDRIGYISKSRKAAGPEFDEEFYERFHDVLSAYPRWDLKHDSITTVIERAVPAPPPPEEPEEPEEATAVGPSMLAAAAEQSKLVLSAGRRAAGRVKRRIVRS